MACLLEVRRSNSVRWEKSATLFSLLRDDLAAGPRRELPVSENVDRVLDERRVAVAKGKVAAAHVAAAERPVAARRQIRRSPARESDGAVQGIGRCAHGGVRAIAVGPNV